WDSLRERGWPGCPRSCSMATPPPPLYKEDRFAARQSADLPIADDLAQRTSAARKLPPRSERQQVCRCQVHPVTAVAVGAGPVRAAIVRVLRHGSVIASVTADIVEPVRPGPVSEEVESAAEALLEGLGLPKQSVVVEFGFYA